MRWIAGAGFVMVTAVAPPAFAQGELVERTLAIVGTQVITLSDTRAADRLGLVEAPPDADTATIMQLLVDRELILREVQRYAPPAPTDSQVETRLAEIRQALAGVTDFTRALEDLGFTEIRLRAWVRDDLRTIAYLAQRFASASTPTDTEVSNAYARQRAEFDKAGASFEQAASVIRERLVVSRRRELISDWVSELRRRSDVVILGR